MTWLRTYVKYILHILIKRRERGSNENNNRMIRRYIPKGRCIDDYSREQIALIEDSINNLPRKILGYLSAKEAFEIELEKITKTKKFS